MQVPCTDEAQPSRTHEDGIKLNKKLYQTTRTQTYAANPELDPFKTKIRRQSTGHFCMMVLDKSY